MKDDEETESVCDCYPEHCEKYEEHGVCWCDPEVIIMENGNIVFVHNDEN